MLERFFNATDQGRAQRVIQKLASHYIWSWVLTGGLAVEIHHIKRGADPIRRPLSDIDFLETSFDWEIAGHDTSVSEIDFSVFRINSLQNLQF
jgi:hypothetical protein